MQRDRYLHRATDWATITGNDPTLNKAVAGYPLWWIYLFEEGHRDGPASFQQFKTFAEWTEAHMVQWDQNQSEQGVGWDSNWMPGTSPTTPGGSTTTTPVSSGSGQGGTKTYTVQSGDTLSEIAERFGVSLKDLADANDIADPDLIHAGEVLTIP